VDKLVDFSQPIEAMHMDGRIERACVVGEPDYDGDRRVDIGDKRGFYVNPVGNVPGTGWRIHNSAKPSTPFNEELTQRMEKLVRLLAECEPCGNDEGEIKMIAIAKAIVSDLPKPVDPIDRDLIEARECVALVYEGTAHLDLAESVRAGRHDDRFSVQAALLAISRNRTLAAGGTVHE